MNLYKDMIKDLVNKHDLSFYLNLGGAEFVHEKWGRCQVPSEDYQEDYKILKGWVEKNGLLNTVY